jgi:hypothetical protein
MSCLEVNISLASPAIVTKVADITERPKVFLSDVGNHLSFTVAPICGVGLSMEIFEVAEGVFFDRDGRRFALRKDEV